MQLCVSVRTVVQQAVRRGVEAQLPSSIVEGWRTAFVGAKALPLEGEDLWYLARLFIDELPEGFLVFVKQTFPW